MASGPLPWFCQGSGSDGRDGVLAIKAAGGVVIVQDAATAEFPGMPRAAIDTEIVDRVLPLGEVASALASLVVREEA